MLLHGNLKSCGSSLIGWQLQEVSLPSASRRPALTLVTFTSSSRPSPGRHSSADIPRPFTQTTANPTSSCLVRLGDFLSILCSLDPTCWFFQPSLDPPRWVESGPPCEVGRHSFALADPRTSRTSSRVFIDLGSQHSIKSQTETHSSSHQPLGIWRQLCGDGVLIGRELPIGRLRRTDLPSFQWQLTVHMQPCREDGERREGWTSGRRAARTVSRSRGLAARPATV